YVERRGGWDCHGLPVELEVEKELGLTNKEQVRAYGVDRFNARCRESVEHYVEQWTELTERLGFWLDTENDYWTMSPRYVESVWRSLKKVWDQGLLYRGTIVVPHCSRCQTTLSSHELSQGYRERDDLAVYLALPLDDSDLEL